MEFDFLLFFFFLFASFLHAVIQHLTYYALTILLLRNRWVQLLIGTFLGSASQTTAKIN